MNFASTPLKSKLLRGVLAVSLTSAVVIGGLSAANALQGPHGGRDAFPWSKACGHPSIGDKPGIYIWHDGDTVNIVSHSEHPKTAAMRVTVKDGKITDYRVDLKVTFVLND